MKTLLHYWTFRYVILHSQMASRSCQEQADCTVSSLLFTYIIISPLIVPVFPSVCAHKVEQMGCWMCLFHMTHFCLVQLEQFCFPYLLNEVLLHLFALKGFILILFRHVVLCSVFLRPFQGISLVPRV